MRLRLLAILGMLLGVFISQTGHAQAPKPDPAALVSGQIDGSTVMSTRIVGSKSL